MKHSLKRLTALLLALTLCLALGATAFAAEGDETAQPEPTPVTEPAPAPAPAPEPAPVQETSVTPITVSMPTRSVSLNAGDTTNITARTDGEGSGASYAWHTTDAGVARVSGSNKSATITAVGPGRTNIALLVTAKDGRSEYGYIEVNVASASVPVKLSGGGAVTVNEGESKQLSASVSGGSGSYEFSWDTDGDAGLALQDKLRGNATIFAGRAGSGTVLLTVFDAADRTNNATVRWTFTVNDQQATAPTLEMNRGAVDLGSGASATLMLNAAGGSGSYDYVWHSDNPGAVTVTGNGATAEIRAAGAVIAGGNRAVITAYARDKQSGLTSNTVSCVVTVSAGNTTYNAAATAEVGGMLSMRTIADQIAAAYRQAFGSELKGSAGIRFTNPGSNIGSIRFQNGAAVQSGTSYSLDTFRTMSFRADAPGTFSTAYLATDGVNGVSGAVTVTATGGVAVLGISLSQVTITMPTYSSATLNATVSPINADYTLRWDTSNTKLLTLTTNGNNVTLKSNGNTGTAKITATVTDVSGNVVTRSCTVQVHGKPSSGGRTITYDTSLTITLGSDYYGSTLADSMTTKFRSAFGVYPADADTISFNSLGNARYGTMYTRAGAVVQANRTYTFRDWADMYFIPAAAGTYTLTYQFHHGVNTMVGTIKVNVQAAGMTATMSPTSLRMAPYSSQFLTLAIEPAAANYRVKWETSNAAVATVSGSNATAVVNSVAAGTAVITATVTDIRGFESRRSCTVLVTGAGASFDPSVSTTLGIPYVGTGTSAAMRNQFAALYGTQLSDNAVIRFASSGNTDVAVMRLADGTMIRPDVNYSLAQYVAMYTQPVSQGTYSVPYVLSYAGKELSGTVSVNVSAASISTNLNLPANAAYAFSDALGASTGGTLLAESIRNTVGANWAYIRFGSAANEAGTLLLDRGGAAVGADTNVTAAAMANLYFVPGSLNSVFTAPYTVYSASGAVIATGTLNISRPGAVSFADVAASAYYAPAVNWAVAKGVTSGTSSTTFSPDMTVTRGQAVTFLWRAAGQPKALVPTNPFTDVAAGAYYYDAVLWAVQQGITNGTSDTAFSPDARLNRDQLLTFLCRASGSYADGADWSQMAVNWATSHGLLAGVPGTFTANAACPRSEVVYYLWKGFNG